jgi:O-antigen/teichoic acid export membrane protein
LTRQALHSYATIVVSFAAQFAAGIAVARALGPSGKGAIAYAGVLAAIAAASSEGIRGAISREVGVQGRSPSRTFGVALRLAGAIGLAGAVALAWCAHAWPATPGYAFAAVAFPFICYLQAAGAMYALSGDIERINVMNTLTIGGGGALVTLIAVVAFHPSLTVVLAIWLASNVGAAVVAGVGLRTLRWPSGSGAERPPLRDMVAFAVRGGGSSLVSYLALRVDVLIVGALQSPAALGVYTLGIACGDLMLQPSRALSWAAFGRIASLPHDAACRLGARIVRSLLALETAIALVLFLVGPWLITIVYGGRFSGSGPILQVLLPGIVLYSVDGILSSVIAVRANRPGLLLALESGAVVLCAAATVLGIRTFGLIGAALADSITYAASFGIKVFLFARYSGLSPAEILVARPSDVPAKLLRRLSPRPVPVDAVYFVEDV